MNLLQEPALSWIERGHVIHVHPVQDEHPTMDAHRDCGVFHIHCPAWKCIRVRGSDCGTPAPAPGGFSSYHAIFSNQHCGEHQ